MGSTSSDSVRGGNRNTAYPGLERDFSQV